MIDFRDLVVRAIHRVSPVMKFKIIYYLNLWGNPQSRSGPGSTLEYTSNLRKQLPGLLAKHDVKYLFDAPCGDFNWFSYVKLEGLQYIGGDIVPEIVKNNQQRYGQVDRKFILFDITNDKFPDGDLWFCRDCLFHLSNEDIKKALRNYLNSNIPYLMITSHLHNEENRELPSGTFRPLNLYRPPYNFPPALQEIDDYIDGFPKRIMGLWHRDQFAENQYFSQLRQLK